MSWASRDGLQHDRWVALTPSWIVWILKVVPVRLYFSSLLFCIFEHETIYTIGVLAVFDFYCCTWACNETGDQSNRAWKPPKLGLPISFPLWGFSSPVTFTQVTALSKFTNLCLVLLLLLAGSLVPKFHFKRLTKKKAWEKSGKWSDVAQFDRWRDSFSSALCFTLW